MSWVYEISFDPAKNVPGQSVRDRANTEKISKNAKQRLKISKEIMKQMVKYFEICMVCTKNKVEL